MMTAQVKRRKRRRYRRNHIGGKVAFVLICVILVFIAFNFFRDVNVSFAKNRMITGVGTPVHSALTDKEMKEAFPLLLQTDSRWADVPYGDDTIEFSGCAPTCMSMVIVALTRDADATPDKLAEYAMNNGYYEQGCGTSWTFMTEGGSSYGIYGQELSLSQTQIFDELEQGHPIICSVRPGDFTTTGHFIVLVGTEDGKIQVNDPNSKKNSKKLWDYDELEPQIKNLWMFN